MSMTDPIADMLTRIRNGYQARHDKVEMPWSKMKENIAKILQEEGFINGYKVHKDGAKATLRVMLRYVDNKPIMLGIERISKPGRRIYKGHDDLPKVRNGVGVAIISTSKGLLTDEAARRERVGGEVICAVW